jgi:hypothetical protein
MRKTPGSSRLTPALPGVTALKEGDLFLVAVDAREEKYVVNELLAVNNNKELPVYWLRDMAFVAQNERLAGHLRDAVRIIADR